MKQETINSLFSFVAVLIISVFMKIFYDFSTEFILTIAIICFLFFILYLKLIDIQKQLEKITIIKHDGEDKK